MRTWAIVPIKHLSEAKSGLSSKLKQEHRRELVLCMLEDILSVLSRAPLRTLVVSPDDEVLKFAGKRNAACFKEPGLGLNGALKLAIRHVASDADAVLILPGDLPLLRDSDIEGILALATSPRAVVISPSKTNGTNALFLRPPDLIELRFGGESFPAHVAESLRIGVEPRIYRSPTIALDIDEPADLLNVETSGHGTLTCEFLRSLRPGESKNQV